ncbi:MAG: hypothetical protein ACT4QC_17895 [Planctomycetaceae bacterium]
MTLHPNYQRLVELWRASHARGRAPEGISRGDVALARLYSHAFRGHVIGAFHATARALADMKPADRFAAPFIARAQELLADLANRAMDPVGHDVRALLSTFHFYATHVDRAAQALDAACGLECSPALHRIRDLFIGHMESITAGNGLHLARDTNAPEQASFIVPHLGISIVPLVYGDYHSWNIAWLDRERSNVPCHFHREGVEIHLGYGPMHGYTILGNSKAELTEGYAMPIPPNTRHGYTNIGTLPHQVPFVFGSFTCGGWGVFLDVEPQAAELEQLETAPVLSDRLNDTIFLDREIARIAAEPTTMRYPIIPAAATDRDGVGGLELSASRVTSNGLQLRLDYFCTVSVVRGQGTVAVESVQREVAPHDHFGIPAGLTATIHQTGSEPLVLLDAVLKTAPTSSF